MGLNLSPSYGQTAVSEEEAEGLKILSISTKAELDEFEQQNIEEALLWIKGKNWKPEKIFTEAFITDLHKRMYGGVWKWAGKFRLSEKNIGVPYYEVPIALKQLLDDALYWFTNNIYAPEEMSVRFKHRLVSIHCFANGNGRHSRLMADIIAEKIYGLSVFSWGSNQYLISKKEIRKAYINAVRAADAGKIEPLILFARS